jgi:DNA-binding winged helix-turn-helix (wHTH) protein/tetratricopeptide (TPR) repeat protein
MSMAEFDRRPFRVGGALVDPVSRDATFAGGSERLQPQTLKVLMTLAGRQGAVVTRDELVHLCWDGRIVGEDVINRSISLLRHFAERAGGFTIETVPRTGYRLRESSTAGIRKSVLAAAVGVLALAGIGTAAWLNRPSAKQGAPDAPTITVLPFTADSNDPATLQVAQAAPVSLSRMLSESGVPIVLATSASAQPASAFVLTGHVSRNSGALQATVHMDETRGGRMVFSHDFAAPLDRSGDFPDQIGAAVAADLAWTGAEMALDRRHPPDPELASGLMQSIALTIEQHDSLRAYQISRRVAALAPHSGIAQLSLAVTTGFTISSIPRADRAEAVVAARRAGDRALALAPEFGDVYIPACLLRSPVRMVECDARLRKAMRIDPSTSFVPGYLSALLYNAGRIDEATQLAQVSLANDPYKPAKLARMIRMFEATGGSDEAERLFREATRLWPDMPRLRASRLAGMAERGNYGAIERFLNAKADAPMLDPAAVKELLAARRMGDLPRARRACSANGLQSFTLSLCMTVLAGLGDTDGAFALARGLYPAWPAPPGTDEDQLWLDRPDGYATAILTGPAAKTMRADPRFLDLARSQGLLAYWRKDGPPDFCRGAQPEPICAQLRRH